MSEWTSIEKSFPPEGHDVLVYGKDITGKATIGCARRLKIGSTEEWWEPIFVSGNEIELDISDITHWMPLPEPPKGGEA